MSSEMRRSSTLSIDFTVIVHYFTQETLCKDPFNKELVIHLTSKQNKTNSPHMAFFCDKPWFLKALQIGIFPTFFWQLKKYSAWQGTLGARRKVEREIFSHDFFFFCFFFFKIFYLLIDTGEGREKERERNINVHLPLVLPLLGTWPATQACSLTRNQTCDPLVCRPALNPLSHTSQGF